MHFFAAPEKMTADCIEPNSCRSRHLTFDRFVCAASELQFHFALPCFGIIGPEIGGSQPTRRIII
jgi:hypothetical protein